jgi:hypothetical protein
MEDLKKFHVNDSLCLVQNLTTNLHSLLKTRASSSNKQNTMVIENS